MTKSSTKLSQRSVINIYVKEMFQDSGVEHLIYEHDVQRSH